MTYKTPPLLSIVTPSYNQGSFIRKNLESVLTQDYPNIEHIVVDGGSTDETVDILKRYETKYNLKWISEPDRGQSHAVNKGIEMANGDWIGWQNSDDYYLDGAFDTFRSGIKDNSSMDLLYGDVLVVDKDRNEINRMYGTYTPSPFINRNWSLFANNQSMFVKRSALNEVGKLNEQLELAMDADLLCRILQQDLKFTYVPDFIGALRIHPEAKTAQNIEKRLEEEADLIYNSPRYEKYIPDILLKNIAKGLKALYLIRNHRLSALAYNFPLFDHGTQ